MKICLLFYVIFSKILSQNIVLHKKGDEIHDYSEAFHPGVSYVFISRDITYCFWPEDLKY